MRNALRKSTLREIRGSFSRWIAILAICALGVSFFSGLKVCREDFLMTGNTFLDETNFFDYKLVSTLGLEEKDVTKMQDLDGIALAEGSWSSDVLFTADVTASEESQGEQVAHVMTLSDQINKPSLSAGHMPMFAYQCLADSRYFTEDDIGKKIVLAPGNDEDTLDLFAYEEYEITGLCDSPMYLNFERGSTALGDGSVACFFYVPPKGWDSDVFTEIYVTMESRGYIYSDEYEANADAMEKPLEAALETCASSRYDEILAEAYEELEDAEKKLEDAKEDLAEGEQDILDGEKEVRDALRDIEKGEKEIADNEKKLADAQIELDDGWKEYYAGLEDFALQRSNAYADLHAQKAQIDMAYGTPMYEQYLAEYEAGEAEVRKQFAAAKDKLDDAQAELEDAEEELADGRAEIKKAKKELKDGRRELADARRELADGRKELEDGKKEIADAEEEIDDAWDEIEDIENPDTYVLSRDTNIGYACFDNDTSIIDSIAKVFPVFFFLIAALVCMTTMTRMIDEQRTQIGVLKALGYSKGKILGKYIFYAGSASLIGSVFGFLGGAYLFPAVIWSAYNMMYDFAPLIFVLNWILGGASILAAVLCCVLTTILCCNAELSNVPAELIRPKAPALGKRILLERIPFLWNRLKFLHKVCLRNIFRYKKRFFMMVVGICGCTALLITGMGLSDSIKGVVNVQYNEIFYYDYSVIFDKDLSEDEQDEFVTENAEYVDDTLFLHTMSADIHVNDIVKSTNMIVCRNEDPIGSFIDLHNDEGPIAYPQNGHCIINSNLAENLNVAPGDELKVYDGDMQEMTVTIDALCDNYVYNYIYINYETYEDQWGSVETNSALVIGVTDENGRIPDVHAGGAALMDADNVTSVSINQDMQDRIDTMMESLDLVIILIILCAGALAFIVLYNLTNINITERIREIATLEVLGFYVRETNAYVFRENFVLTAISAVVGVPVGILFHQFVMNEIQVDMLHFDVHIAPLSFGIAIALTFLFTFIVNFAMYFRLRRINMAESLKSIE